MKCPRCRSENFAIEKRPDGDTECTDCGFKAKSKEWPDIENQATEDQEAKSQLIESESEKEFRKFLEENKEDGDQERNDFMETTGRSVFFKGLAREMFIAGMLFSNKMAAVETMNATAERVQGEGTGLKLVQGED